MRQLVVVRRICCCSQFMIFLLEPLGPAKQPMAGPSSSNRKIMDWEQQQILLTTTNCLILAVVSTIYVTMYLLNTYLGCEILFGTLRRWLLLMTEKNQLQLTIYALLADDQCRLAETTRPVNNNSSWPKCQKVSDKEIISIFLSSWHPHLVYMLQASHSE